MLRNWHTFVLPSFVSIALLAPSALAEEGVPAKDRDNLGKRLDKLEQSLRASFKQVGADMKALQEDIKTIKDDRTEFQLQIQKQIADLKADIAALKRRTPPDVAMYPPADKAGMDEIRSKLAQIEFILGRLQAQQPRVSLSSPTTSGTTGTVRLVNSYATEVLFVVNGQSQRVPAGATVDVQGVPAGTVRYEAIAPNWGVIRQNTTGLAAGETLSLVVR